MINSFVEFLRVQDFGFGPAAVFTTGFDEMRLVESSLITRISNLKKSGIDTRAEELGLASIRAYNKKAADKSVTPTP
jgi:hypothetical protein